MGASDREVKDDKKPEVGLVLVKPTWDLLCGAYQSKELPPPPLAEIPRGRGPILGCWLEYTALSPGSLDVFSGRHLKGTRVFLGMWS